MKPLNRLSLLAGAAALLTAVLVIGGVQRWTQSAIAVLTAVALIPTVRSRRLPAKLSPLLILLAAACAFTALQLLPLPTAVLEFLNPVGMELRQDGASIAGTSPPNVISMDPPATVRELAMLVILAGFAVLGLRISSYERGRHIALMAVALACCLAAVVTGVHALLNADAVYGLYEPQYARTRILSPFLNPNHLGSLMSVGTPIALGLALYLRQSTQWRVVWIVAAVVCALTVAVSQSRGALLALIFGLAVTTVSVLGRRAASARDAWRRRAPAALVLMLAIGFALYLAAGDVANQLERTSVLELHQPTSKYEAWRSSLQLVRESPWVGIGRGAVESTLTRVHPGSARSTFAQIENEYLSALLEWGIVGTFALAIALGWCAFVALRRWNDGPLAAGGLGALAAVSLQSTVDFGLRSPGIACTVVLVASTLLYSPLEIRASMSAVRLGRCILVLALALSAAFLASDVTASVREERARLPSVAEKQRDALRNSIERHPFDYLAFGERAALAEKSGEPDAIRFLNHALRLHPTHPSLHRLAARMLADRGYWNHAAVEYALAMRGASSPRSLLTEILDHAPDASSAAAAIAADHPDRGAVLRILGEADRDDVALAWLERIARTPPTAIADLDLLYETATRHSRLDLARFAAELRLRAENSSKSRLLLVRVLHGAKDHAELLRATSHLPSESGRHDDRLEMWLLRCDAFVATREWTSALECLHELERTGIPAALGDQGVRSRRKEIEREREAESRREALERLEMKPRTSAEP